MLNERERRIFEARRIADNPATLEELAIEFGVSPERVRQIEVRAFQKVQKAAKTIFTMKERHHGFPELDPAAAQYSGTRLRARLTGAREERRIPEWNLSRVVIAKRHAIRAA